MLIQIHSLACLGSFGWKHWIGFKKMSINKSPGFQGIQFKKTSQIKYQDFTYIESTYVILYI